MAPDDFNICDILAEEDTEASEKGKTKVALQLARHQRHLFSVSINFVTSSAL